MSHRKFIKRPLPESSWKDIPPNFGIIKGLNLEYLEFPHKIKRNAPIIPEPTYSGKAHDEPEVQPPPDIGPVPDTEEHSILFEEESQVYERSERSERSGTKSSEEDVFGADEINFLDEFGQTPDKKDRNEINWEVEDEDVGQEEEQQPKMSKFVPVQVSQPPPVESESEDPAEIYIREELERRANIADLKKMKAKGIEVGGDIMDDMDLQTSRIRILSAKKNVSTERSISMNRFGLMGAFLAIDQSASLMTDSMKGYFQFQMEIINTYDDILEEMGETQFNAMLQELDPNIKLGGMVCATTAAFWIFQNYVGEDKVKGAKLIKHFFPKQAQIIEDVTNASKKQKEINKGKVPEKKKKKRGPSFTADDVNNLE